MTGRLKQTSITRDFALLAGVIVLMFFLLSVWVAYYTFDAYSERIGHDLKSESERVENLLTAELDNANYLLTALGNQIAVDDQRDIMRLARMLRSFDTKGHLYSILSWITPAQRVVVSSNRGVLEKPVDVSDRDYVKEAAADPWKMHIGKPIEGRVSGRWVLPVAMGVSDSTGKLVGVIMSSLDIHLLTERLTRAVNDEGARFIVFDKALGVVIRNHQSIDSAAERLSQLTISPGAGALLKKGNLLFGTDDYFYYLGMTRYPYIALLEYDMHYSDQVIRGMLWSRLAQFALIAGFVVAFLWLMRSRMVQPITEITAAASAMARGDLQNLPKPFRGPQEISALATEMGRLNDYLSESKRVEGELRNKLFSLRKAKERAEISTKSKSEFLAYVCQEIRSVLNNIVGFSQAMRDQLHGPIENKKYRAYASDMYSMSQSLLEYTQNLLSLSKAESGYTVLADKPIDVVETADKTIRFLSDRLQAAGVSASVHTTGTPPRVIADELCLRQMLANMLVYALHHVKPGGLLSFEISFVRENRDRHFLAICLREDSVKPMTPPEFAAWYERLLSVPKEVLEQNDHASSPNQASLSLDLIRILAHLHQGEVGAISAEEGSLMIALFFPHNRIDSGKPR